MSDELIEQLAAIKFGTDDYDMPVTLGDLPGELDQIMQLITNHTNAARIDEIQQLLAWAEANELELEARNLLDPEAARIPLETTVLPKRIEALKEQL